MENVQKENPEIDKIFNKITRENEKEKEEKLVNLIIEIIVQSTLKEYYEACDKISQIQPIGTE